jgi:heme exporter protein A
VGEPAVRAEGLVRRFAGTPVLSGIDLVVAPGDVLALLGANGAGKTTLLRCLALLLRPNAGRLTLFGTDAGRAGPALRRRIGWVGHESCCYPDLTGAENLALYAELFALASPARRVAASITWAGLDAAAHRPVRVYSRGMAQRLALARALLHEPELLLLDEPFTGLDPPGADALGARLAELAAGGCAVVLASHDLERLVPLATRLVILRRGRIAWTQEGRAADAASVAAAYAGVAGGRP